MTARTVRLAPIFILAWMAALTAIAAYIRLHGADFYYYNPDEAMHASIAAAPTLAQVLRFSTYEVHPPLTYFLLHYWMHFSADPAFVRGFSLLFGLLTLPVYYGIGVRLNGRLTGLACAALAAFGNGCIIQSYVVRQYGLFLFLISAAFYAYLRWREDRRHAWLWCYGICAALAALSHFSAVFTVFCLTLHESACSLRTRPLLKALVPWLAVNSAVGMLFLCVYHLWQPILLPLKSYFAAHAAGNSTQLWTYMLFYPLVSPGYILPRYAISFPFLIGLFIFLLKRPPFVANLSGLRSLLRLNLLAFALGMALVATRLYPEPGTRHSLWLAPFVIAAAGWMLSDTLRAAGRELTLPRSTIAPLSAVSLLAMGWMLYSPAERFKDSSEYVWPRNAWEQFLSEMGKLGPGDFIVTEKDDGILLANLYPAMADGAFAERRMAALVPYANSAGILFNPYYPRNYTEEIVLATLRQAQARHMLDGARRLVFLRMNWSRSPVSSLMACDAWPGQLDAVSPFAPGMKPSLADIEDRYAIWMTIPIARLSDILDDQGAARACLNDVREGLSESHFPAAARVHSPAR